MKATGNKATLLTDLGNHISTGTDVDTVTESNSSSDSGACDDAAIDQEIYDLFDFTSDNLLDLDEYLDDDANLFEEL